MDGCLFFHLKFHLYPVVRFFNLQLILIFHFLASLHNGNQKFGFFTHTPILSSFKTVFIQIIFFLNFIELFFINYFKDMPIPSPNISIPVPAVPVMNTTFPITTVFVGNITELCSNDLVQKILKVCLIDKFFYDLFSRSKIINI